LVNDFRVVIICIIFIIFCQGCKNNQSSGGDLVEAEFTVDSALLNNIPYRDSSLNIEIRTPLGWSNLDSETTQKLEEGLLLEDYKNAKLKNGLINNADSSLFLIVDVSELDDEIFVELKKNYQTILNKNNRWSNLQLAEFKINCFRLEQYVMQSTDMIHFKLIGYEKRDPDHKAHFELWFFVNPRNFEKDIKFVESSIGSLNCLTFKK